MLFRSAFPAISASARSQSSRWERHQARGNDALQDNSTTTTFSFSYSFSSFASSSATTTTTSTTPSHRVGWPRVGGRIRGKPRVSHDCSFRANPAFAVTTIWASREDDDDIVEDSSTNTTIATTKTIK